MQTSSTSTQRTMLIWVWLLIFTHWYMFVFFTYFSGGLPIFLFGRKLMETIGCSFWLNLFFCFVFLHRGDIIMLAPMRTKFMILERICLFRSVGRGTAACTWRCFFLMFFFFALGWHLLLAQNTKVVVMFVCRILRSPGRMCSLFFAMGWEKLRYLYIPCVFSAKQDG